MDNYLITFIVPVYKVEYGQLRKCIESIIGQKGETEPYEILLVDDGSPDDCPKICDEYAEKYANIRVLHQANQGLSVVRNHGVENAKGEWVAFVDGDDWIEPDFVEFASKSIKMMPDECDIFLWDGYSETKNKTTPIHFFNSGFEEPYVFKGAEKERVIDKIIPRKVQPEDIKKCTDIGITWGRIYRRSLLIENKIENVPGLKVMQDSVFNLWAIEYARAVCYQDKPLYHYSMYDESVSKKYDSNIANTMKELYGHFADYIRECHDEEKYWQRLYVRTVRTLVKCLAKDYANPLNTAPMSQRIEKMKKDLAADEFQTALHKCDTSGQEFKFRVILFLLKHKMYRLSIMASQAFGWMRRTKNHVS
jgi:glycosyltransferase involved in cell wall biosynthesis